MLLWMWNNELKTVILFKNRFVIFAIDC